MEHNRWNSHRSLLSVSLICVLLIVTALLVMQGGKATAQSAPADPVIQEIIDQVTTDELMDIDRGLSGEDGVVVGGELYTFTTRYTRQGPAIEKAWQYAYEQFEQAGVAPSYHDYTASGYNLRNAVGTITGTLEPTQQYLLTAHIDDISDHADNYAPGADDNGSGSSLLILAARILSHYTADKTMKVIAFTGEEQYLWGSAAYAAAARSRNDDIQGVLNADMIAWDLDNDLRGEIHAGTRSDSQALAALFVDTVGTYSIPLTLTVHTTDAIPNSDHSPFWQNNYPAFLGIEQYRGGDFNLYLHTTSDRVNCGGYNPCGFNQAYFTAYAKAMIATLARLAGVHPAGTPTSTVTGTPPTNTPTRTPTVTPTYSPTPCAGNTNYTVATATATVITGGTDIGNHTDDGVTNITLPFPFRLYDQTFTTVALDSNGRAVFPTGSTEYSNVCLPLASDTYTIYPYWDDLYTANSGYGIFTQVLGTAPNRLFVIYWHDQHYPGSGTVDFNLVLHEAANPNSDPSVFDIVFGSDTSGGSETIGVQKDQTLYTQYLCDTAATNNTRITFTEAGCGTPGPTSTPGAPTFTPTTVPTSTQPPATETEPPEITETPEATNTPEVTGTPAPPTPCEVSFSDVPPENTFYPYVRCLACRGVLSGYDDGTFRPYNNVTRGQISKVVSNAAGFNEPIPPERQTYADVLPSDTFWLWIERLTANQVMSGYNCGEPNEPCDPQNRPYFRPYGNATRAQLAKIADLSVRWPPAQGDPIFADVPPDHPFYEWIQTLASRGVISGYDCGIDPNEPCDPQNRPYFRPYNNVTRGQGAKIVSNVFFPNCETPARP